MKVCKGNKVLEFQDHVGEIDNEEVSGLKKYK